MARFDDQVCVVTGAGAGIGAAAARRFASEGGRVVVADIDSSRAAEVGNEIVGSGGQAVDVECDVTDPEAVRGLAALVERDLGPVDVLVNNVGHYLTTRPFATSEPDHWQSLYEINLLQVFAVTHAFLPPMLERGRGAVVNVSSVEGLRGFPRDPVYAAMKAAVAHFTRCLALEAGPHGVRVNAVAPDLTESEQVRYREWLSPEEWDRWPQWAPLGHPGAPDDQAAVIAFLASHEADFVTGHVVPVDGGTLAAGGWFRRADGTWTNRPSEP